MAEQPNVTEPVVSKPKSTTPVFYSIPDTASAVQPVVYEPKQPTGGATPLAGLLPTEAGTASNELARTATDLNNDRPPVEEPPFFEVFKENLAPTMAAMIENTVDSQVFEQDMSYEPQEDADEFFKLHGQGDPYEINVLGSAISAADMLNKQDRLLRRREQQERASQRPFAAIAGSMIDIDLLLGGVGGFATKAGTGARVAERLGQGAVAGTGIYAYNEANVGSDVRAPDEKIWDVVGFGLSRALAPSAKAAQRVDALDNAVDAELATVRGLDEPTVQKLPDEPTYTHVQTGVRTETKTPDLKSWEYTPKAGGVVSTPATSTSKASTSVGAGVKTQYQVPPTQSTTVLNPKGYGVNTQQHVLTPKLQQQVQEAQEALEVELKAPLKTSNTAGLTRAESLNKSATVNKVTSGADELAYYIKDDPEHPAYHLLASVTTEGDNVATAQAAFMNTYGALLVPTEVALKGAIKDITGAGRGLFGSINGSYQENALSVFKTFQAEMQKLDSRVLAFESEYKRVPTDAEIKSMLDDVPLHPSMRKVMDTYINSGFAMRILDDSKTTGVLSTVENADSIVRRPTYFPVKHNYDNMHNLVQEGKATWDDLATFYGEQITTMYPRLLDPKYAKAGRTYTDVQKGAKTATTNPYKLTVKQVGQHFIETQRQGARSLGDVTTVGMNKEVMHDMLTKAGLTSDEAATATKRIFDEQTKQGTSAPKNYKRRIEWDWNRAFTTSKGEVITMADLVDNSAMSSLDAYSRRMAHRNGLGRYGIRTEAELDKILESIPDTAPKGTDPQEVRRFLQDVRNDLLGNATGTQVPNSIRAAQSLADMFLLAGSGLLSLVDLTTQVVKTGVIKNFGAIHQGMKAALLPMSKFTKDEAKDFTDIMTGRLMQGSRWKWFMTHYSDNFQVGGGAAEAAQYYGQSARFMNMSETVKRFQIGMLMGTYLNTTKKAAQGSASDIKFLKTKMNMHDDLINGITTEWKKHGGDVDAWNADVRIAYEQKIMHESDNLALTIQKGETPAILEYNAVGKVIFPYMRYAFSAQQKILRRTYNRDGAVGLALLLAAQTPVAMLVASAQNIRQGKEPDEDLVVGTIRAMTALGALNYPLELIMSGFGNNSVTAIAPFSKSYNLVGEFFDTAGRLQDGDYSVEFTDEVNWHNVLKNSPLNAATPLHYLAIGFED